MQQITFGLILLLSTTVFGADEKLRDAVRTNDVERVRQLLDAGADANSEYENEFTPIYFAEDPRVVDLLIAHGAKLETRDSAVGYTPLESIAEEWYLDEERRDQRKKIIDKLKNAGAEYTVTAAIYLNDTAFVKSALEKDDTWVNKRPNRLRIAARTGRLEICKALLDHKADPDAFEEGCGFPIMVDAVKHPEIVKLLIQRGANLRRRITWLCPRSGIWPIGDEATALHHAVGAENLESVKLLIAAGLDPNAMDQNSQTPLHLAIRFARDDDASEYTKIVEHLLKNDASLRLTNQDGKTPPELAKELRRASAIRRALEKRQKEID